MGREVAAPPQEPDPCRLPRSFGLGPTEKSWTRPCLSESCMSSSILDTVLSQCALQLLVPTHNLQITFLFFSYLNLSPNLPPPPQYYTFRRLNSNDHTSFLDDLKQASLITNPPQLLNPHLDEYDTTLHSLIDKHAPVTTKRSTRQSFSAMVHRIPSYCSSRLSSSGIYLQIHTYLFRPFYIQESSQSIS